MSYAGRCARVHSAAEQVQYFTLRGERVRSKPSLSNSILLRREILTDGSARTARIGPGR
jgi:hypothetical protein